MLESIVLREYVRGKNIKEKTLEMIFTEMFQCSNATEYKAGSTLCKIRDPSHHLYTLVYGLVTCIGADGTIYRQYEKGEIFGDIGFLQQAPRTLNVICTRRSLVFALDYNEFQRILRESKIYGDAIDLIKRSHGKHNNQTNSSTTESESTNIYQDHLNSTLYDHNLPNRSQGMAPKRPSGSSTSSASSVSTYGSRQTSRSSSEDVLHTAPLQPKRKKKYKIEKVEYFSRTYEA